MAILISIIQILAAVLGSLAALLSIPLFLRAHWPAPMLWILKLYISALSPVLFLVGLVCTIAGLATGSMFINLTGIYVTLIFFIHIYRVTRAPDKLSGFDQAFGSDWQDRIDPKQQKHFLRRRTVLRLPTAMNARMEQDIAFATVPDTGRQLLCNLWQPPENITPSGVAFIYLFGSAWYLLDKDLGTRPFFNYLAAQGHMVMDVAYRLAPETDLGGMVSDVKRGIVWMKEHARTYGVDPDHIVVGGGSAGGHLALLAAYTSGDVLFTPTDLEGKDTSVCAVISLYGPTDLAPMYYHTNQHLTTRETLGKPKKAVPTEMPKWIIKKMGKEYYRLHIDKGFVNAGSFAPLLGGHPDECPERYALFSPITHVHADCPPTLLIHGEHDCMAPVKTTRNLHDRLVKEKVQTAMHILPQTDHAFDLFLPKISPSAHNAIYDIERFLALQQSRGENSESFANEVKEYQPTYSSL